MEKTTVIIVGGGPVGLTAALGLAQRGVDVTVLDKAPEVSDAPRAIAYLQFVHPTFAALGVLDDLKKVGLLGNGMNFIDYETGENFHNTLDVVENDLPYPFVLHLGQDVVGKVLIEHMKPLGKVDLRYNNDVVDVVPDDDGVLVTLRNEDGEKKLRADWLIAADGASSLVRKALNLDFDGITWPDRFISTNIRADLMAEGLKIANWRIDPVYGAIIAKFTEDNLWRFTFREDGALPDEGLEDRIHAHFAEGMPGHAEYELVQYQPYRMHQRAAETFRVGRVLLAGDAAHITNPTGGLGLTGGFLDASVLSEALAAVIAGTAEESVLDKYSDERRRVFLEVVSPAATANKKMLFDNHSPEEKAEVIGGLRFLMGHPEVRRQLFLDMEAMVTPSLLS